MIAVNNDFCSFDVMSSPLDDNKSSPKFTIIHEILRGRQLFVQFTNSYSVELIELKQIAAH